MFEGGRRLSRSGLSCLSSSISIITVIITGIIATSTIVTIMIVALRLGEDCS